MMIWLNHDCCEPVRPSWRKLMLLLPPPPDLHFLRLHLLPLPLLLHPFLYLLFSPEGPHSMILIRWVLSYVFFFVPSFLALLILVLIESLPSFPSSTFHGFPPLPFVLSFPAIFFSSHSVTCLFRGFPSLTFSLFAILCLKLSSLPFPSALSGRKYSSFSFGAQQTRSHNLQSLPLEARLQHQQEQRLQFGSVPSSSLSFSSSATSSLSSLGASRGRNGRGQTARWKRPHDDLDDDEEEEDLMFSSRRSSKGGKRGWTTLVRTCESNQGIQS